MIATVERPPGHMVLSNVSWQTFETLLDEIGEVHYRVAYDNGDLEFMTISLEHDNYGRWIGRLIFFVALEMNIPIRSGGSTTLKKSMRKVGLEPDECFWIKHEKQMLGRKKWNARIDPPPDLAVEIDISTSWLDRLGICAALGVPEVWRWDGEALKVLILGANGRYRERFKSFTFPNLPLGGLVRFIRRLDDAEEVTLIQEFIAWLRNDVIEVTPNTDVKNGKKR